MIEQIHEAKDYWIHNNLDEYDFVLLLPHDDEQFNNRMIAALAGKILKCAARKAIVLSVSPIKETEIYVVRQIPKETSDFIILLYSVYAFTGKLIIGSFHLPYGRKLRNLLDSGIASEEELINDVLLEAIHGT